MLAVPPGALGSKTLAACWDKPHVLGASTLLEVPVRVRGGAGASRSATIGVLVVDATDEVLGYLIDEDEDA